MANKLVGLKSLFLPLSSAVVIMIAIFFIKPAYFEISELKKEIEANTEQLKQLEDQNAKMKAMEISLDSMEEKPMVMSAMPEQEESEKYLAELYGRASRSGVLLKSFSSSKDLDETSLGCGGSPDASLQLSGAEDPSAAAGGNAVSVETGAMDPQSTNIAASQPSCADEININFTVSGSWDQTMSFLKYIEDTSRIADIVNVDMTPATAGSDQGTSETLSVEISLKIFNKPKSETVDIALVNSLASGEGFSKISLKKIEDAIYGPFDYSYETEATEGKNIFK